MKLLRSTKSKITKDENGENIPNLQITKIVPIHMNTVNNDYQQDLRVLYTFVPNNYLVNYLLFHQKLVCFF